MKLLALALLPITAALLPLTSSALRPAVGVCWVVVVVALLIECDVGSFKDKHQRRKTR